MQNYSVGIELIAFRLYTYSGSMVKGRPLVKSAYQNYLSYFSTKTYVVGSQNAKHMLKLIGKKIFTILRLKILFI